MASGLAVVTGASSGIGYELAKCCAEDGYDLIVCADDPKMTQMTHDFGDGAIRVEALIADLGTREGVDKLWAAIGGRPVDLLLANAGRGLGHAFLDQDFEAAKDVIDVNITGTMSLIHKVGRQMRERNQGAS